MFNCYTYQNRENIWSLTTMTLECYACLPRYLLIDIKITNYRKAVFLCTCNNVYTCYSSLSFSSFWRYLILFPNHLCNTIFTSTADINRKTTQFYMQCLVVFETARVWKFIIFKIHETAVVKLTWTTIRKFLLSYKKTIYSASCREKNKSDAYEAMFWR